MSVSVSLILWEMCLARKKIYFFKHEIISVTDEGKYIALYKQMHYSS